jgi:hypothetical protein
MNMTADEPTVLGVALGLGGSIAAVSLAAGASQALTIATP